MSGPYCALVTLVLWTYFIGGFVFGYAGVFLGSWIVAGQRGIRSAMRFYLRGFFFLLRLLYPRLTFTVPERDELTRLRGCVLVANHRSYLDPLLLFTLVPNTMTLARANLFKIPVFGWLLHLAGFVPSRLQEDGDRWLARFRVHLENGANVLIFPEGTRSRNGQVGPFRTGAFFLAQQLRAPLELFRVSGTERVFEPGRFLFHIGPKAEIEVRRMHRLDPSEWSDLVPLREISERVRAMYVSPTAA